MGFSSAVKGIVALCITVHLVAVNVEAQQQVGERSLGESVEWASTVPMYYDVEGENGFDHRRSLYGRVIPIHSYISYGALSANRVPCPPRSGRSYYTHNCFRSSQPVNPYTRGCSCITHCRR